MDPRAWGFTVEEYVDWAHSAIFEVRNSLVVTLGYGEMIEKELPSSHPAHAHLVEALRAAERAYQAVKNYDREVHRRRLIEEEKRNANPDSAG